MGELGLNVSLARLVFEMCMITSLEFIAAEYFRKWDKRHGSKYKFFRRYIEPSVAGAINGIYVCWRLMT